MTRSNSNFTQERTELQAALKQLQTERDATHATAEERSAAIESLQQQFEAARQDQDRAHTEVQQLQAELTSLRREHTTVQSGLVAAKEVEAQLKQQTEQLAQLRQREGELSYALTARNSDITRLIAELRSANIELEQFRQMTEARSVQPSVAPAALSKVPERAATANETTAYCLKCHSLRTVVDAHDLTMPNGRRAMRGQCAVCGTSLLTTVV